MMQDVCSKMPTCLHTTLQGRDVERSAMPETITRKPAGLGSRFRLPPPSVELHCVVPVRRSNSLRLALTRSCDELDWCAHREECEN